MFELDSPLFSPRQSETEFPSAPGSPKRFKKLDPLLHSELRLAIMSILASCDEADFVYIREQTEATAGNLSVQLDKLTEAGYIETEKGFAGKKPRTVCRITGHGRAAFSDYIDALKSYFE